MGKFIGFIARTLAPIVGFALGSLVGGPIGAAIGSALFSVGANLLFGPKAPKTPASETQIKNPIPSRVYGYGTRRLFGAVAFWGNTTSGATVDVIAFADGQAHAVRQAYINDEKVTVSGGSVNAIEKKYQGGKVKVGWNLGETPAPVHSAVVSALPGVWTAAHRGDGVVSGYLIKNPEKEEKYLETYPQGDNATLSLVLDLQLCFDPRNTSHDIDVQSTWQWTENPVLHLLHYFVVRRGYSYEVKILPQIDKWIAAANVCDEVISGEARYRGCVLYDSTAKPAEVIGSMLETFDGWYCENELGEIAVYAGEYYTPSVTIGPDQIVEYEHKSFVNSEDVINELAVSYISSEHDYNQVEAQPWRDDASVSQIGAVNSSSFGPQVPSFKQARRLAKISMARNNTPDRGVVVTNYGGRIAEGHRFINLLIEEAGVVIYDGPAEVNRITRNLETHGLTIEWTRAEPASWDWNPATEDGYGASTGTFPTIAEPDAPTITGLSYFYDGNGTSATLTVAGTGPNRDDLTWYVRAREAGTSAWSENTFNDVAAGTSVSIDVPFTPTGLMLEVQLAYSTGSGKFSGWSASEEVEIGTATSDTVASLLFASSEQGVWFDPSDLTTMFQDSAGTVPAAVDQPVGRILDKSGNGNHASQATSSKRPMLRRSGSRYYLEFDGTDDCLVTGSINFTLTDKVTAFAGIRKTSDATLAVVVELSAASASNNGSFFFTAPATNAGTSVRFSSKGTISSSATDSGLPSPVTAVISGIGDISGDIAKLRVNGTETSSSATDQGTGNYGNYPVYIGQRGASSAAYKGNIYGLILRGAATGATEIASIESYMNEKTGAY